MTHLIVLCKQNFKNSTQPSITVLANALVVSSAGQRRPLERLVRLLVGSLWVSLLFSLDCEVVLFLTLHWGSRSGWHTLTLHVLLAPPHPRSTGMSLSKQAAFLAG